MTTLSNGQVRKSLSSQIDRLDTMLDGLADGLNELVVTAVKQAVEVAVKEAVRSVLSEVLTNPQLVSKLQGAMNVPAAKSEPIASGDAASTGPSLTQRLGQVCKWIGRGVKAVYRACVEKVQDVKDAIGYGCGRMVESCKNLVRKAGSGAYAAWQRLRVVRALKYQLLTALTVGALCGTGVFFGGPCIAAVAGGIGWFGTACAVQMGLWFRRMLSLPVELVESL